MRRRSVRKTGDGNRWSIQYLINGSLKWKGNWWRLVDYSYQHLYQSEKHDWQRPFSLHISWQTKGINQCRCPTSTSTLWLCLLTTFGEQLFANDTSHLQTDSNTHTNHRERPTSQLNQSRRRIQLDLISWRNRTGIIHWQIRRKKICWIVVSVTTLCRHEGSQWQRYIRFRQCNPIGTHGKVIRWLRWRSVYRKISEIRWDWNRSDCRIESGGKRSRSTIRRLPHIEMYRSSPVCVNG